jgi:flagellar hook-associated protein 3
MSIGGIGGRLSSRMQVENMLSMLRRGQAELARVQSQLMTGRTISSVGQDPLSGGRTMDLSSLLAKFDQFSSNTLSADSLLSSADSALGQAADLLRQAHTLALDSVDSTLSDAERAGNAQIIGSIYSQLLRLANTKANGRYLFDGQSGQGDPFVESSGGVVYAGGGEPFRFALSADWTQETALDGATVFNGESSHVGATLDLNPQLNSNVPLADLNGATGMGIRPGVIRFSDGIHAPVDVDLSQARTVGDIVDIFNHAVPAGITMTVGLNGVRITAVDPAARITIQDLGGGKVGSDLGILATNQASPIAGGDLDARLTEKTLLIFLRNGAGVDQTGVTLSNGGRSATISLAGLQTVQDLMNAVDRADIGARVSISDDGRTLQLTNLLSGSALKATEAGGSTAAQLGWRTFNSGTSLDSLNGGLGVGRAGAGLNDFRITQRDGTTIDVSLAGCQTVGEVLTAINTAPGNTGDLVASIDPVAGIKLLDSSVAGGSNLTVTSLNGSAAAGDLGIQQSVPGNQIVGTDTSGATTGGVFDHLLRLRQAVADNNTAQITRQAALLEADLENLVAVRGAAGAQAADVAAQADRLEEQRLNVESVLSKIRDVDMTEAVVWFQQLQNQLSASMLIMSRVLNLSLLDYIG